MTNDDFTTAARAEAERYVPAFTSNDYTPNGLTAIARLAHVEGWKAARTHLAAQEPTDAEVEAAARALYAEDVNESYIEWPAYDSPQNVGRDLYTERARNALSAARAARRDEEKR